MRPEGFAMSSSVRSGKYPRMLRIKERELLESVLPAERPGYRRYREMLDVMVVLGEGRRGPGNLVLGYEDDEPDTASPLAQVVAYGVVETTRDQFSITIREEVADQIDVEMVSRHGEEIPDHFEEKRRWSYSEWVPGASSPANGQPVREVPIGDGLVLAISPGEERLWLYDGRTGMNHLIPVTNYHNELMRVKQIRDPQVALKAVLLFREHASYTDAELRAAFVAYNKLRPKVPLTTTSQPEGQRPSWKQLLMKLLGRS
jgi:hypothetical protein